MPRKYSFDIEKQAGIHRSCIPEMLHIIACMCALSPSPVLLVDDGKVSVARRRNHHRSGGGALLPVADALVVALGGAQDDRRVRVSPGQLRKDHGLGLESGKLYIIYIPLSYSPPRCGIQCNSVICSRSYFSGNSVLCFDFLGLGSRNLRQEAGVEIGRSRKNLIDWSYESYDHNRWD